MARDFAALAIVVLLAACGERGSAPAPGSEAPGTVVLDSSAHPAVVALEPFPDTPLGAAARRGLAILEASGDSLAGHVGNSLRCTSCHLDGGRRAYAMTWVGVTARYPQYRHRAGAVLTVEDRVQECIERSLAGRRLAPEDPRIRAMLAYFAHISRGVPVGTRVPGQGVDSARATAPPDSGRGAAVYALQCARCHGVDGAGLPGIPAVWGSQSYTIAAGMARVQMAAAFIKRNMPFDAPGTLTDQDAVDVAAYINAQPRGDYAPKAGDWPLGGAPADVPFRPTSMARGPR
jgi:thiosulfate dehydrogenase